MNVEIRRLSHGRDLPIPRHATNGSAGVDLVSAISCTVSPGEIHLIPTGIIVAIPSGCVGLVAPRSGLATRYNVTVANSPGVIDSDYRGECRVALHNRSAVPFDVNVGDRIAQLVILHYLQVEFTEVEELTPTARGDRGWGSTGIAW